jgi:hypothetical protein
LNASRSLGSVTPVLCLTITNKMLTTGLPYQSPLPVDYSTKTLPLHHPSPSLSQLKGRTTVILRWRIEEWRYNSTCS